MRILYLIDTLELGGAERSLLEIVSRFHKVEPRMCHLYVGDSLKSVYQRACVPVASLNIAGKYAFRRAVGEVTRLTQQEMPDLIHTTLFRSDVVGRLVGQRLQVPVVSSLVNESYARARWRKLGPVGRLKLWTVRGVDAVTARLCSHFVANSETIKMASVRALGIPAEKVSVIYRGRDPAPFLQVTPDVMARTRAELGLVSQERVILNVARLVERKGQAELIRAMPTIVASVPQVRLLIAGEGVYHPVLEALIEEMGLSRAVSLLRQRDDIPALLHLADVFVFPSHFEGWPGALVEAMLAGCPIVASDTPVHKEAITDGETGRLVTVESPRATADGVLEMLREPDRANEMGERAREVAMERFDIDRIAAQHEVLYEQVLERWRGQRKEA